MESHSVPLGIQMSPAAHAELLDELRKGFLRLELPRPDIKLTADSSGDLFDSELASERAPPAAPETGTAPQQPVKAKESGSSCGDDSVTEGHGAMTFREPERLGPAARSLEQLGLAVQPRGKVLIKGKGLVLTYWLERHGERPRRQEDVSATGKAPQPSGPAKSPAAAATGAPSSPQVQGGEWAAGGRGGSGPRHGPSGSMTRFESGMGDLGSAAARPSMARPEEGEEYVAAT